MHVPLATLICATAPFVMTVNMLPQRRSQFDMSAVSSHWRQTALSSPELWISMDITVWRNKVGRAIKIMRAFLARSGRMPLSIGLDMCNMAMKFPQPVAEEVLHILSGCSPRLRELHLIDPPEGWINVFTPSYTILRSLSVVRRSRDIISDELDSLDVLPCSRLALSWVSGQVKLRWTAITVLRLAFLSADLSLKILRSCVNLTEFRSKAHTYHEGQLAHPPPAAPFILPYIRIFEWPLLSIASAVDSALLRFIRMPVLDTLVWHEAVDSRHYEVFGPWDDPRVTFFDHLPATLSALHLDNHGAPHGLSYPVLRFLRRELRIETFSIRSTLTIAIENLCRVLTREMLEGAETVLPNLRRMYICLDLRPGRGPGPDPSSLLRMLESRLSVTGPGTTILPSIHLELKGKSRHLAWILELEERAREIIQHGLEFHYDIDHFF
ncbi:hypothetical protein NP233_g2916 [Leucocoprinus birnbaumii]|uniref:F-box domain-containing protein n=1 Tax=Leucocoprinus birnbaumii TaxID=56174 RepID=A0AAD5YWX2_9AGAR|nr:hypothetical protein NP233_g2916 [Leucocoprinus birnbaumii]